MVITIFFFLFYFPGVKLSFFSSKVVIPKLHFLNSRFLFPFFPFFPLSLLPGCSFFLCFMFLFFPFPFLASCSFFLSFFSPLLLLSYSSFLFSLRILLSSEVSLLLSPPFSLSFLS